MALEKTEALVLRTYKFGETSKIISALSRDFGRIKAIAKGVRGAKPRFGAALETFARMDLVFYRKAGRDLHLVAQADLIDGHLPLSDDVLRYAFGLAVVEFLSQVVSEEETACPVYDVSAEALRCLACSPRTGLPYVLRAFQVQVVSAMGHSPELTACVSCADPSRPAAFFSPHAGGVLCSRCSRAAAGARPLAKEALAVLRQYSGGSLAEASGLEMKAAVRAEVGRLMEDFLAAQIESYRGLKSLKLAAGLK